MLTGTLLRVRTYRNRLMPQYLDVYSPDWLAAAERLLIVYRESKGRTRSEIETDLEELITDGPEQVIVKGLAKLLDDRCEYDAEGDFPPEKIRESAFRLAAEYRKAAVTTGVAFDRNVILKEVADELTLTQDQVDVGLFADLKAEQRVVSFDHCTAEYLLKRYNVALAQAVLIRSTGMEVVVRGESTARFRQLFRAAKFHKLIGSIKAGPNESYLIQLDGPLSLFSSTQKYGLQLALFLPTLMHCSNYELKANVRWGAQRKERQFVLSSREGIASHSPVFGMFRPKELDVFAENFAKATDEWTLSADPAPVPLGDEIWVPDFLIVHRETGQEVHVEVCGYWRKLSVERQLAKLKSHLPGRFLLLVGEQYKTDEAETTLSDPDIVRYKRTPSATEILKVIESRIAR